MKAAGHVLPLPLGEPWPRAPGAEAAPPAPGAFSVFQEMSPGPVGACIREVGGGGRAGPGPEGSGGCPVRRGKLGGSSLLVAPYPQQPPRTQGSRNSLLLLRPQATPWQFLAMEASFLPTSCLSETSSVVNLRLSGPGQATSLVWVSEEEGRTHSPRVLSSGISPLGKGGRPSRLTSSTGSETLGAATVLSPLLSPPGHLVDNPGQCERFTHASCIRFCFFIAGCCPPSGSLSGSLTPLSVSECPRHRLAPDTAT